MQPLRLIKRHPWFFAAVALVMLAALPVLLYPMGRDQGMYANIGRSILHGGIPYLDMWDIKPPPIYYLYAFAIGVFGPETWALRTLDFIAFPITAFALYWLGLRLTQQAAKSALVSGGRAEAHPYSRPNGTAVGAWAVLLFGVFYFTESFASLTQSDSLITMPMALAVVATFKAMDAARASRAALFWSLLVGALCGLILWFKHYHAFFVLALVLNQLIARRAFPVREALAFALGGLLTGGALLAYFAAQGMVPEMLLVAQGTAAYNAQGYDFSTFSASMQNYLTFRWWHWGPLIVLAALWWPLRASGKRQNGWRLILLWLGAALAFALVQAKGFDTHWLPMLPALALLGADSLDRILRLLLALQQRLQGDASHRRATADAQKRVPTIQIVLIWLVVAGFVLILGKSTWGRALPYMLGQQTRIEFFAKFQANDVKPDESLRVVQYLQQRVAPGDTLFIWGFRPEVMYMGAWRPATRFQAHFPLVATWYPQSWQQENVDTLWAAMPPYVLLMQADYMPWVTGRNEDSNALSLEYTHFINFVMANYERVDQIGNFWIWRRMTA